MPSADPSAPRRFLVIRNPAAGRRHPRRLRQVLALLRQGRGVVDVVETRARGDARRLARDVERGRYDVVVAAGGDGTISEVVNGLVDRREDDLALGIIALGTANVLAREIGVGQDATAMAAALLDGAPTPIAVGQRAGGGGSPTCFVQMVGAGFDAHVVAGVGDDLKRWLGKGAYAWRSLVELLRYRNGRYRLEIDGDVHSAASAIVSRGRLYGGAFVVAPAADQRRPVLSVCLFERGGRWQVLRYGAALMLGRLPVTSGYRIIEAAQVRIEAANGTAGAPEPLQVDGDRGSTLPVSVTLSPR
ncbi:MAG TPA: diacylglycerol kinase family protein, partial [Vineibacter sp.]|nr:diacylglycerol kinase family protein [Vineibacter sp.]